MMNDGYARLASTLDSGAWSRLTPKYETLELGMLQEDGSLKVDRYGKSIPAGQYLRCRTVELLEPGKRVLVGWTNDGTDPIVIDEVIT